MTRFISLSIILLLLPACMFAGERIDRRYWDASLPVEKRIEILLEQMTLEEKVNQLCSGFLRFRQHDYDSLTTANLLNGIGALQYINSSRPADKDTETINAAQKFVREKTRLGIPLFVHGEALHGHVGRGAASFPQAIALASTWDRDLVEEVFSYVSCEARSRGTNFVFSPVLDIARDPRWGRMEETYGEDPYLVSEIGLACVRGLQGRDLPIGRNRVASSPKHFAAYGQCAGGRNFAPANVPERLFREEILEPFRKAVKIGHIKGIMPSHSEIDGIPAHTNEWLLTGVLREELGFDGVVVSDYHDVERLNILHHIVSDNTDAAKAALKAGVNFDLPISTCYKTLTDEIRGNREYMAILDKRVSEILKLKFEMGLFENPYSDGRDFAERKKTRDSLTYLAAAKAVILLKNENGILPLDRRKIKKIAVVGPNADVVILGGYSPKKYEAVTIRKGLENMFKDTDVQVLYSKGCEITKQKSASQFETGNLKSGKIETIPLQEEISGIEEAAKLASECDIVVLCVGDNYYTTREAIYFEGNLGDRSELQLVGNQDYLVRAVIQSGTPVVAVLMHGRSLTVDYLAENADAIVDAWYLGEQTGTVIADILSGMLNPGGKLPVTYPRKSSQLPVYYNQRKSGFLKGYLLEDNTPLWPFGFGLSYTNFKISDIALDKDTIHENESCIVHMTVSNTGKYAGDEVVQIYIRDVVASVTRPIIQLKGFSRISLLPGESRKISIGIPYEALGLINEDYEYEVEPGEFKLYVGTSSDLAQLQELSFHVAD